MLLLLLKKIYLFLAVLGLCSCKGFLLVGESRGHSLAVVHELLIVGFSCCGLRALGVRASVAAAPQLWGPGSVVVAHGLRCSTACGIFPDQGWNPRPRRVHRQADSLPLSHQGSPEDCFLKDREGRRGSLKVLEGNPPFFLESAPAGAYEKARGRRGGNEGGAETGSEGAPGSALACRGAGCETGQAVKGVHWDSRLSRGLRAAKCTGASDAFSGTGLAASGF